MNWWPYKRGRPRRHDETDDTVQELRQTAATLDLVSTKLAALAEILPDIIDRRGRPDGTGGSADGGGPRP